MGRKKLSKLIRSRVEYERSLHREKNFTLGKENGKPEISMPTLRHSHKGGLHCQGYDRPANQSGRFSSTLYVSMKFWLFFKTLSFQQIVKHLFTEGTVPVPPNRPCALQWYPYYLLWSYRSRGGATAARAEALYAIALEER